MLSIQLENLSHVYQRGTPFEKTALRNITLDIEPGTFVGIAGRSGSGKTTLVQHLNGLLKPTAGRITFDGSLVDAGSMQDLRKRVGLVFQHPEQQLFEETVYKDISFGLSGTGLSAAETGNRVREALGAVGLGEELLERSPFELSGGEKRRVAIAGVLVMNPSVLVLDEPAAGLDPRGRREILDFIGNLRRERGITVILATHDMEEMARFAERVIVLRNGCLALEGATRDIFRNVGELESAGLEPPQITRLMLKLKMAFPEINDGILTVEEAAEELKRLYRRKGFWRRDDDKRFAHGQICSGRFGSSRRGSEDEDSAGDRFYGACISC
jgi:energy-coupling factor transport system ATP-binding protein